MIRLLTTTILVALLSGPAFAQETASPLVRQMWGGNWPSAEEAQQLRNELFYQRAIHAYMTMQPALNVIGMRDGSEKAFGAGYNVLPIWKTCNQLTNSTNTAITWFSRH